MKRLMASFLLVALCSLVPDVGHPETEASPVTKAHLLMIKSLFKDNGLHGASAERDGSGRVLLGGEYRDGREVSLAFSLAQSVVGVKWTSPVTPENVRVREWAQSLSRLFPSKQGGAPPAKATGALGGKNKFALIVGVSRFKNDASGKNRLKYASKDASEVRNYLLLYKGYKREDLTLLTDEKATRKNVQAALDKIAGEARAGDEVFIYFSSHGAPVYDGSLNIVTYDTAFKNHFSMADSSFPSKSIKAFLDTTRSENVFIVLDVCYSGAVFKNLDGFYHGGSKSISFDDDNQGFSRGAMEKTLLGGKDLVLDDSNSGGGAKVIISASDAGERSWESDSVKASFFTHHFLQELRNGGDMRTSFQRAKPRVTRDVRAEKKAEQNPQAIASRSDWGI